VPASAAGARDFIGAYSTQLPRRSGGAAPSQLRAESCRRREAGCRGAPYPAHRARATSPGAGS